MPLAGWSENNPSEFKGNAETSDGILPTERGLLRRFTSRLVRRLRRIHQPALGSVDFGDLGHTSPVSRAFGYDRGTPVDRFYIEDFLSRSSGDINGCVLEVADATYSARFGSRITKQDVLHLHEHPAATIVADLTKADALPEQAFDCIVITQTLQFIYDIQAATKQLHRALRPGGVVLATVPGISSRGGGEWAERWCWSLTELSARNLFGEWFPSDAIETSVYGNIYAATCFLQGLALEEVDRDRLLRVDPGYPVIVAIRARRC